MLIDARTLPDQQELQADLVVIGAGAAGITIACELASSNIDVLLIESGGLDFDEGTQELNRGEIAGREYYDLDVTRLRFFGGTTNHWGGRCTGLLDPIDFEPRPWVRHSGWPISRSDLEPFSDRAHEYCELGTTDYRGDAWATSQGRPALGERLERFVGRAAQLSPPTAFGTVYRDRLERAGNVRVLLNATVTELVPGEDGNTLASAALQTLTGKSFEATARLYVLACGAIENARVLLLSNRREPAGLGNRHDLVGRYFMEHLSVWSGAVMVTGATDLVPYFETRSAGTFDLDCYLSVREETQRDEQILNLGVRLEPFAETYLPPTEGWSTFVELLGDVKSGELPDDLLSELGDVFSDLGSVIRGASDQLLDKSDRDLRREYGTSLLLPAFDLEQAPNPESRVTLSEDRDALGQNRVRLRWQLSDIDAASYKRGQELLGEDLALAGLGRLNMEFPNWLQTWPDETYGHQHQLGTTRMHADPKHGVVDADCRVHGIGNLYVAGGSVFPTGGYGYPTFNIVTLSIRLAEHLRTQLA